MHRCSPTLLALDTATEFCSVALLRAGQVHVRAEHVGQRHSERLLPMAQALLADASVTLADVDALAFGAGPGSFTGLRIACGAAQGLAFGLDCPVLPVGNLRALAARVLVQDTQARIIGVAIDARMNEIYWAAYQLDAGRLRELAPPALSTPQACADELTNCGVNAIGGNALSVPGTHWPQAARRWAEARADAGDIVRLAAEDWAAGRAVPAAEAAPLYVRDRVAQTIAERRMTAAQAS
ncbi:MAG: tRNA (adenosine(37)-N6)-threonylcarbamoyltransferase complex dimerization subunit type 1 TsaB [Betaproteobacteria bacterium]|jgi:tRNA threonylcarbamoyladenosine biosynthesis protein TsaB